MDNNRLTVKDLEEIECVVKHIAITSEHSEKSLYDVAVYVANLLLDVQEYNAYKAAAPLDQVQELCRRMGGNNDGRRKKAQNNRA